MGAKNKAKKSKHEIPVKEKDTAVEEKGMSGSKKKKSAEEHKQQLERLKEKDPEFYEFLKEHDEELLDFDFEDIDADDETDADSEEMEEDEEDNDDVDNAEDMAAGMSEDEEDNDDVDNEEDMTAGMSEEEEDILQSRMAAGMSEDEEEESSSKNVITIAMVDSWCTSIQESSSLAAVRSLMKAFRVACHYGDDGDGDAAKKLSAMSSSVFNKVMLFVLNEMDGILRGLLKLPHSGVKKETVLNLMKTKQWKNYSHLVQSYLGNSLHILNQMTDTDMISFTLKRLKYSAVFFAAFPALLRKYIKVVVHFWGTGGGALPVVSLLFLREMCVHFPSESIEECFKGLYKAYVLNCQYVTATKLQHIRFLASCFTELLRVDLGAAYQHAFIFIRQLAMILNENFARRKKDKSSKELFRKVYSWKFMHCLELWTGAICAYSSEAHLKPLAYPLTQIITGTARLVPTVQYFPLRLWCIKLLNRIATATDTFIPVAIMLLDMLDIKELNRSPTGGVGEAVDFHTVLKVKKSAIKTRAFQEACVLSVIEELTEHLAKWSYSAAFYELSHVPLVRLQKFCKSTKVERFRKEAKQLIHQIEANCEFTNKNRMSASFLPNDSQAASFLEDEKKKGSSPLSQYAAVLRQKAQERSHSLVKSSVQVGENTSVFRGKVTDEVEEEDSNAVNEQGTSIFSSSWLPGNNPKPSPSKEEEKKKKKRKRTQEEASAEDEDVVGDLILSSDEEEELPGDLEDEDDDDEEKPRPTEKTNMKKQKPSDPSSKKGNRDWMNKKKQKPSSSKQPNKKGQFNAKRPKGKGRK